uniref:Uncharacterized protein n=1 Tax=Ditylenchus dipsaci TaxID=166011 RepID=A0A915CRC4_9BILA
MHFFLLLLFFPLIHSKVRLGLIESESSLIAVCRQAIDDAKQAGKCTSDTVEIVNGSGCVVGKLAVGTASAAEMIVTSQSSQQSSRASQFASGGPIEALVASRCSEESREISRLAFFWKVPVINRIGSGSPLLFDNAYFPTVVQIVDLSIVAMDRL